MSQETLLFITLAVFGAYGVRWTQRLAPLGSELPLKTLLATILCALLAALEVSGTFVTPLLRTVTLLVGPIYVLAPLLLTALARAHLYGPAVALAKGLYWSKPGRSGIGRLIAQVALQQGDSGTALKLLPEGEGDTLRLQGYALERRWQDLLALPVPTGGDNAFLAVAARIQALLALGHEAEAEEELSAMEARWQAQGQGPLGYRSVTLSRARLHAFRGELREAQETLQTPLPGVPPYVLLEILAFAAERAHNLEAAGRLYAQAFAYAPPSHQAQLRPQLERYGQEVPAVPGRKTPYATYALSASLLLLYGLQLWIGARYGQSAWAAAAGFLTLDPDVPGGDGLWRFLSYAFVHGGLLHIGMNVWVLFDIGRLYESRRPWGSLLAAFVLGSLMGSYLTFVAQNGAPPGVIGASGGVLGVGGALFADVLRGRGAQDRLLMRSLLQWIGFIVIFSVAIPGISLLGHIGGLVGGLLWGFMRQGLPKSKAVDLGAGLVSLGLLTYALAASLIWLLTYGPQL